MREFQFRVSDGHWPCLSSEVKQSKTCPWRESRCSLHFSLHYSIGRDLCFPLIGGEWVLRHLSRSTSEQLQILGNTRIGNGVKTRWDLRLWGQKKSEPFPIPGVQALPNITASFCKVGNNSKIIFFVGRFYQAFFSVFY